MRPSNDVNENKVVSEVLGHDASRRPCHGSTAQHAGLAWQGQQLNDSRDFCISVMGKYYEYEDMMTGVWFRIVLELEYAKCLAFTGMIMEGK